MPAKHKVLITGSGGMLGIDLCKELGGDYEVYGIDNRSLVPSQNYFNCDITDAKSVSEIISKVRPEVVIHTAAWTDVDACELYSKKAYKINSEGAENVALACKDIGATLIYISTDFVFDGRSPLPYKETDETVPLDVYADSKLKGEEAVKKQLKNFFIVRTSWLYGKNGKNFVDTIIKNAKTENELKVVYDQSGSPTYTVDLAEAIHLLIDMMVTRAQERKSASFGVYHVTNSGSVSWFEYAKAILELVGSKAKVQPITSEELKRPARRPSMSVLDNSKFTALTGYEMRNWKEALKEYLSC